MAASPSVRYSPIGGKPMVRHRRGLSMEDGFFSEGKEENLELFSELQEREKEEFLIHFPDDFDKTFCKFYLVPSLLDQLVLSTASKLKNLSDVNLGNVVQGEGSELLKVDAEKHDYDWLMTPPETPLFPALDDEVPVNVVSRGRPRTQPVSISRSSTMDKSCRSSRGSPSPNRLSHSPRSATSSTSHSKGRSSLSPSSSHRSMTPFRGHSSPRRTSSSAPRSSTASLRRIGSAPVASPGRGTRGSPKAKALHSNILGLTSEAPPNLRTSLTDRPGSYCRGSSPARNSKDFGHRRKSTSPASREFQEGGLVSTPVRRSLDIGCDDDFNAPQVNDRMLQKKPVVSHGNRSPLKKTNRTFSAGSLPKRSFESPTRQTEYKKSPPNMFRPLLSSAPTGTLYGNKTYSAHDLIIPGTAGDNGSDQIHSFPLGSEITEDDQHYKEEKVDMNLEIQIPNHELNSHPEAHNLPMGLKGNEEDQHYQEGIELDPVTRPSNHEIHSLEMDSKENEEQPNHEKSVNLIPVVEASNNELISVVQTHILDSEKNEGHPHNDKSGDESPMEEPSSDGLNSPMNNKDDSFTPHISEEVVIISEEMNKAEFCDSNELDCLKSCLKCGKNYPSTEFVEEVNLCINCHQKEGSQPEISCNPLAKEFSEKETVQDDGIVLNDCGSASETEEVLNGRESTSSLSQSTSGRTQEGSVFNENAAKNEVISVLFKSSNTGKKDLFQSRSFSSTITYDDLVYAREGMRSVRSSVGTSASSSADFTTRSLHRHAIIKTSDVERQAPLSLSKQKAQMEDICVPLEDADDASSTETNHRCDTTEVGSCSESLEKCVTEDSCNGNEPKSLSHVAAEREAGKPCNEEDSETVLYCKSLVNDLVYHAAALAVDKESSVLTENSRPGLTFMDRSNVGKETKFEAMSKLESKTLLRNPKGMGFDEKVSLDNDENINEAIVQNTSHNVHTPKIESKCYCTVM